MRGNINLIEQQPFTDGNTKNLRLLIYALLIGIIVGIVGAFFSLN